MSCHPIRKDFLHITAEWAKDPTKVFKATSAVSDVLVNTVVVHGDSLKLLSGAAKDAKNACAPATFIDKTNVLRNTVVSWASGIPMTDKKTGQKKTSPETITGVFRAALGLVAPAHDFTGLVSKKFCELSSKFLNRFKGVHGSVLTVLMTWNCYENLEVLSSSYGKNLRNSEYEKRNATFLLLVQNVSFLALGIMTALSGFFAVVFSPLAFASLSLTTVVFGYAEHFYKNFNEPVKL